MEPNLSQNPTELYMEAVKLLELWDKEKTHHIITLLKRVIELDPDFYRAYTTLCKCYIWMGALKQLSSDEVNREVEFYLSLLKDVDHNLSDYYTLLAQRHFWSHWNIPTALRNCNRALAISPNCVDSLIVKGLIYASQGKSEQALSHLYKAERLSPLTHNINYFIGLIYLHRNELTEALTFINKNTRINPLWKQQYHEKFLALCYLKQLDEAQFLLNDLISDAAPVYKSLLITQYYISSDNMKSAHEDITEIERIIEKSDTASPYYSYLAELFIQLNHKEKAFYYLKKGIDRKATPLIFFKINSLWNKYSSDETYKEITGNIFESRSLHSKKYEKSLMSRELLKEAKERLLRIMEEDKPWRNPSLSRSELAKLTGISEHELSQLLNREMNTSFYNYCNRFRLHYFLQSRSVKSNILHTALESGFKSKSTFNAYFKKQLGTTPTEYFS